MKKTLLILFVAFSFTEAQAQNTAIRLCDFDTVKRISFADYNGQLDTMMLNPKMIGANTSSMCARYVRSANTFDNIKFHIKTEFTDVSAFAQANTPNKIKLSILSNMPVGSRIEIQLGAREMTTYPEGIHSVYIATTTAQRQWETLTFNLTSNLSGNGGFTNAGSCNKMVVLFNPNSTTKDTIYFDDVMGPMLKDAVGIKESTLTKVTPLSTSPNPAADMTTIRFTSHNVGQVTIEIIDLLGRSITRLQLHELTKGEYTIPIDTSRFPNGVYFYTLKNASNVETKRLVVAH